MSSAARRSVHCHSNGLSLEFISAARLGEGRSFDNQGMNVKTGRGMGGARQPGPPSPAMRRLRDAVVLCLTVCAGVSPRLSHAQGIPHGAHLEVSAPSDPEGCWIYTHLQKSGGTTVKKILFDFWGSSSTTYDSYQWKQGQDLTESVAANLASPGGLKAAAGGYPEALRRTAAFQPDDGNTPCHWFTVFRHPVSRLVSAYYYCRQDPTDQLCASNFVSSRDVDLVTFARHWGNFAVRQFALAVVSQDDVTDYLTSPEGGGLAVEELDSMPGWYMLKRFLDGQQGSGDSGGVPDAAMHEILELVPDLLGEYAAVGILEDWESTLSLFNAALAMPGIDWHEHFERSGKKNVDARFEGEKEEAYKSALTDAEINKYLRLDLILYEHALDVFYRQKQLYGID